MLTRILDKAKQAEHSFMVGMGAVVAATTHAPLTAILITFELTSDFKLIAPLMAA